MIEAVLFDLFETLITETHIRPTRASSLAPALGIEPGAYRTEWKARRPRVVLGRLSFADALAEVSQTLAGKVDRAAVEGIRQQRIREKAAAYAPVDDGIQAVVGELVRRGIRLGVISNAFKEDVLSWSTCPLASAFMCTLFSCDEGLAKPDPEIYLRAMRRLGARRGTTLYVGDGAENELAGAGRAGIRSCRAAWFVPPSSQQRPWPELPRCEDVLDVVAAG